MSDRSFRLAAGVLIALAWLVAGLPRNWFQDDAYITFRYAANLAQGQGLVFNPGERVFGCTTPLYALLLAGALKLGMSLELASRLIAGLSLAGLFLALISLSRSIFADPWPGILASVFLLTNPVLFFTGLSGMETNLFLALWAGAFASQAAGRPGWAVGLASLSLWCRIEGGVVLAVILTALILDPSSRKTWPRWVFGLFLAALYPPLVWLYYGTPIPQSFTTKLASANQGLSGAREIYSQFQLAFVGQSSYWFTLETRFYWLKSYVALGLLALLRAPAQKWLPLLTSLALYALAYILSGRIFAINFPWYFLPPLLGLYLLAAAGLLLIFELLSRGLRFLEDRPLVFPSLSPLARRLPSFETLHKWVPISLAALWIVLLLPTLIQHAGRWTMKINVRERVYAAAAQWANQVLPAQEMIAANEIGTIGYFSRRKVLDLFGLVSAERRGVVEAVAEQRPALILVREHYRDQGRIIKALPGAYRWQKWRRLWIGVRADLPITVSETELERYYREIPLGGLVPGWRFYFFSRESASRWAARVFSISSGVWAEETKPAS